MGQNIRSQRVHRVNALYHNAAERIIVLPETIHRKPLCHVRVNSSPFGLLGILPGNDVALKCFAIRPIDQIGKNRLQIGRQICQLTRVESSNITLLILGIINRVQVSTDVTLNKSHHLNPTISVLLRLKNLLQSRFARLCVIIDVS